MTAISFLVPTKLSYGSADVLKNLTKLIQSIEAQKIPKYEILLCGDIEYDRDNVRCLNFNEQAKQKPWITKKFNDLAKAAKYSVLCYLKDYNFLYPHFYEGFEEFGYDWDLAMCPILNKDLTLYRCWTSWCDPNHPPGWVQREPWCPDGHFWKGRAFCESFNYLSTEFMYISGMFWMAKKSFMLNHQFNENLCLGEAEDILWSKQVLMDNTDTVYKLNTKSCIGLNKFKDRILPITDPIYGTLDYILQYVNCNYNEVLEWNNREN